LVIPRPLITTLVALGLFLPVVVCVLLGVESLLSAMGDAAGSLAVQRFRLAGLVIWILDLVALLFALGLQQMGPPPNTLGGSSTEDE
jgi:hypothetical protein